MIMREMEYQYKWRCEDRLGNILNVELRPNEYWARISPIVLAGPIKLYFNMRNLLVLKSCLGYLVRAMRKRETNFYRMFESDNIKVTSCMNPLFVVLSFKNSKINLPPELWFSLRRAVELRREISDAFVNMRLSQKKVLNES